MEQIIPPVERELIEKELTEEKFIRNTNYGDNQLFSITAEDSPNIMREIGRLREVTFRNAGGGTGKELDVDKYDTSDKPYHQLIVWDPESKEILGGYRYFICQQKHAEKSCELELATNRLFTFTDKFRTDYIPYLIELGRSFVQPAYQSTAKGRKSLFALDNLWDGLGAIVVRNPHSKYFFGKVTMYPHYPREGRNMILYFLDKYFRDEERLIYPTDPIDLHIDNQKFEKLFVGNNYKEDYKILSQQVRQMGVNIPPLINAYANLSPTMKVFGTIVNPHFGMVEETGIMVTISEVSQAKVDRHIGSYDPNEKM